MHRKIGSAFVVLGLLMLGLSFVSLTTAGGSNTTTGSSSISNSATSTSGLNTQGTAFSSFGVASAPVSIDGGAPQNTPFNTVLTWGSHAIACGSVSGYTALNPSFTVFQDGTLSSVTCSYVTNAQSQSVEQLLVTARFYSISTKQYAPLIGFNVQVSGGPSGVTNSQGQITFNVLGGATYNVCVLNSGYGTLCGSASVGSSAASLTLTASTYGFSIIPVNNDPLGIGLSSAQLLAVLGLSFMLLGGFTMAFGGRIEGES